MAAVALLRSLPCVQLGRSGRRPAVSATADATSTNTSRRSTKHPPSLTTLGASVASLPKKKVLVPVGMGTEDMEAVILVDVLRRAGADVTLASVEAGTEVVASSGTRLIADVCIGACVGEIFDLIALPGGMPGSARLRDSKVLQEIMCKHAEEKRLYGAICAAPAVVLQPWGLLRRKYMTGHPAFMDKLPTFWAVKSNIQVSGELTTSRGPGTAFEFALSFVHQLFGSEVSDEIGGKLVLIPIAHGSEEMEVIMVVDILRRAMVDVVVASVEKSVKVVASQRTTMVADKPISAAAESKYDLIILPGGVAGVERMHKSRILRKLLKAQKLAGRVCGAICSSPIILQKQGLLANEKVTAHPSVTEQLSSHVIDGADVVIDGKLITSKGLGTVVDFSLAIVSKLFGHNRARSVAEGIVFHYPKE